MASASSTSAKNLFVESKMRLADRVQVNVNNVAAVARQIQKGSKSNELLMGAAKQFALHEHAIENSETEDPGSCIFKYMCCNYTQIRDETYPRTYYSIQSWNLRKLMLLSTHLQTQHESLAQSSGKLEDVLEQVRAMQR